MISGSFPFEGDNHVEIFDAMTEDYFEFVPSAIWDYVPDEIIDLIKEMLKVNPEERIAIDEVINHRWFKKVKKVKNNIDLNKQEIDMIKDFYKLPIFSRCLISYATRYLEFDEIAKLSELFMLLDDKNHGYLDLSKSMNSNNIPIHSLNNIPSSQSFRPNYRKHSAITEVESPKDPYAKYLFKVSNYDSNSKISYSEFIGALMNQEIRNSPEIFDSIFDDLKSEYSDSEISLEDFLRPQFFNESRKAIISEMKSTVSSNPFLNTGKLSFIKTLMLK